MAITPYLAMTAAEYAGCDTLPSKVAWMACHFSPYSTGLSNLPAELPKGSLLIVNDSTPIYCHSPETIAVQLAQITEQLQCCAVLLDFQRISNASILKLAKHLCESLSCPTGIPAALAEDILSSPVFLPPCPLCTPLDDYIAPWQGREIWLETALEETEILLTGDGAALLSQPHTATRETGFQDLQLHCHYKIEVTSQEAKFTLWRTPNDLEAHLQSAEELGITRAIGLYQELQNAL